MKYPKAIYKIKDIYFSGMLPLVGKIKTLSKGKYFIVPSTFDPLETGYSIDFYSSKIIQSDLLILQIPDVYKDLWEIDEQLLLKSNLQYYSESHIEDVSFERVFKFDDLEYLKSSLYSALAYSKKQQEKINDLEKRLNISNVENVIVKEDKNKFHKSFRK